MNQLIKYTSCEEIQMITGEDIRTIKQWKKGTKMVPIAVTKLLQLYVQGDASFLLGPDWKNYIFRNNLLYIPEWRRGLSTQEIRSMFCEIQLVASLKREIKLLKSEIEKQNIYIDQIEIKAQFYKRQLGAIVKSGVRRIKRQPVFDLAFVVLCR